MMANKLTRALPQGWRVTVVDRDDRHIYQPGLLFVPFGDYEARDLVRPRAMLFGPDVRFVVSEIDPVAKVVALRGGEQLRYDLLVLATCAPRRRTG